MKVELSDNAVSDLNEITDWIASDNPLRAATFIGEIRERCKRLGVMPRAYPLVPRNEDTGVRRCPFREYLIFYRVTADAVEILRVLHGARDIDALLFPED